MSNIFTTKETIENLTLPEFESAYEEFQVLVAREHAKLLEMEAKDEFGSTSFNTYSGINFFRAEREQSEDLMNADMEDMIKYVSEFQEYCKQFEDRVGFYVQQKHRIYGGNDYYDLEEIFYELEYKVVITEVPEQAVNTAFKSFVTAWLAPTEHYARTIDCKLLQLFKQGAIDWKTLRTLVYSDCKI